MENAVKRLCLLYTSIPTPILLALTTFLFALAVIRYTRWGLYTLVVGSGGEAPVSYTHL